MGSTSDRWDGPALRAGAVVSLVIAMPFAIAARSVADDDTTGLAVWLSLAALGGFLIGAGTAAWAQRTGYPISHALVATLGTYVAVQAVFVVVKLLRGGTVNWLGTLFTGSAITLVAVLGGLIGRRMRDRGLLPSTERPRDPS